MRSITPVLTDDIAAHVADEPVARASAFPLASFRALVEQVARLSYLNKDHLLFYRGQSHDFQNKAGSSTIYPTLYRGERVTQEQLDLAVSVLESSAARLCDLFESEGLGSHRDVRRRRLVQWGILQHYQVCSTPLVDLTHSLRVACSFAFLAAKDGDPYVFVLGLPYITNRISVNSEHDLVNVRLLSICPPEALRPYFQEGYLAATDDILADFDFSKSELDFNNRLIAKFRLTGGRKAFWAGGFRPLPRKVLYPPDDHIEELCARISDEVDVGISPGLVGSFLQQWTRLESTVMGLARDYGRGRKIYSMRSALDLLQARDVLPKELISALHEIRKVRNDVVHRPTRVPVKDVGRTTARMRGLLLDLEGVSEPRAT